MFDHTLKLLLRRLGLMLVLYMLLRLFFYFFNYSTFSGADVSATLLAFLHGLRFDLAALTAINAPFILLSLWPHGPTHSRSWQRFLLGLFVLLNVPFLALALIDLEFFKFIGRRSSNEIFTITGDILNQLGQLALNYWYLGLGFLLVIVGLVRVYPRSNEQAVQQHPYPLRYLRLLLVIALAILAIRGGVQLKPLRTSHAFILQPAALGHLTLNSPFTFIKSIGQNKLEEKHYFSSEDALLAALPFDADKYKNLSGLPKKENVVIIILESFASEYVGALNGGKGYTPFLDSLATQGLLFKNNFANGRKSIEALPSVLAGLPSLMQEPYITSAYQGNTLYGLGAVLQEHGYKTAFFHGAANGTMGFNNFSKLAGMSEYYGLDEYPSDLSKQDFDGQWGIFDEPYLQYVSRQLTGFKQPFLATLFTLSSHQPYTVPAKYKGQFPKGELEIHESIGYADHALREFFKNASLQPWYQNTLFILTADHTQESINPAYQNELGHYRVPLLLFRPGQKFESIDPEKVTQQADIFPTVVDYLNLPTRKLPPFGQSVLDSSSSGRALFYNGNSYFLVQPSGVTELTVDDKTQFYTFPDLAPAPPAEKNALQLKAYVQYFRSGMVSNRLYLK
ncbi:LTA synthase family protein [Pontibacter ruber]|uniref:LTA synthase family protein n=1 Tax=Pontibacter ruber TaxID=1343895 RepID=A0ABW5CS68_9BACT|nr:alkaline phosphatase family protein [Pontibacter ruber]